MKQNKIDRSFKKRPFCPVKLEVMTSKYLVSAVLNKTTEMKNFISNSIYLR